jgi:hypothetical protein
MILLTISRQDLVNPELRLEGGHGATAEFQKIGRSGVGSLISLLASDYNFLGKRALMKCIDIRSTKA